MNEYRTYTVEEAMRKMEHYCAYQERCHKEVREKLKEMRMIPMATDVIITHLITNNFLNEERFARSFARGKFRMKKWGRHRIIRELKNRELSAVVIKAALQELDPEVYFETLNEVARKRWEILRSETSDRKRVKKLTDYLVYRGWEIELIREVISELELSDPDSDGFLP